MYIYKYKEELQVDGMNRWSFWKRKSLESAILCPQFEESENYIT